MEIEPIDWGLLDRPSGIKPQPTQNQRTMTQRQQ
jgi:hypothetical protein